jgi:UDP-galactopyranose mutase
MRSQERDVIGDHLFNALCFDGYTYKQWQSIAEHLGEHVQNGLT